MQWGGHTSWRARERVREDEGKGACFFPTPYLFPEDFSGWPCVITRGLYAFLYWIWDSIICRPLTVDLCTFSELVG